MNSARRTALEHRQGWLFDNDSDSDDDEAKVSFTCNKKRKQCFSKRRKEALRLVMRKRKSSNPNRQIRYKQTQIIELSN